MSERIDSDFAILDVKRGRVALAKRINSGDNRIPVTIRGYKLLQQIVAPILALTSIPFFYMAWYTWKTRK